MFNLYIVGIQEREVIENKQVELFEKSTGWKCFNVNDRSNWLHTQEVWWIIRKKNK